MYIKKKKFDIVICSDGSCLYLKKKLNSNFFFYDKDYKTFVYKTPLKKIYYNKELINKFNKKLFKI